RMEIIRLAGYVDQEKFAIARQFLVPKQLCLNGLDADMVEWDNDVIPSIVHSYTREAGVRELERRIGRVARKLARRRAEARDLGIVADPVTRAPVKSRVKSNDLRDLLGIAPYDPSMHNLDHKVGVATGLAYTSVGGEVLEIEVTAIGGRGKLQLTGTLGD